MESSIKAHSFLKRISGPDVGKIYPLFSTKSTIGRGIHNTVSVYESFLSRKHCSISYENSGWIITDHGGLNGTYLNGQKMESSSYCVLNDKTIIFLGDPEESTCGFIFLTSLPPSAQQSESSVENIPSTSAASVPLPSSPARPSSSTSMELGETSNARPDQSDDVSSTRSVLDLDRVRGRPSHSPPGNDRERPSRSLSCHDNSHPDNRNKFKERIRRLLFRNCNPPPNSPLARMLSPLNDRVLPILFDANTESPRSTLRRNMDCILAPVRQELFDPPAPSLNIDIISSDIPSQTTAGTSGLELSRDSLSLQRTSPRVSGSSRTLGSITSSPLSNPRVSIVSQPFKHILNSNHPFSALNDRETYFNDVSAETASGTDVLEQSIDSLSAQRTYPHGAGSSKDSASKPCEFDVLDMLVDSVNSDQSDSDCSISSLDSLRTRIRKQKVKANRALPDGRNQTRRNSKEGNASSSSDEVQLIETRLDEFLKSEDDSESLICNIKKEVKDCENEMGDKAWTSACTSKPDDSDTLQYLKDRVLKLQKHVMDVTEALNAALDKEKEQTSIIEELQKKQGIIKEQVSEDLEAELSCNICTEVLIKPVILNCGHIFCQYCIGVWKKKKKQCPNCRDTIKTESDVRVLDSYIGKVIDRLEPMYRMKRNELLESRKVDTAKLKKSNRKRSPYHRIPTSPESTSANNAVLGLRGHHNLRNSANNSVNPRRGLTLRLRDLTGEQAEIPLIRRLVDRIERRNQIP